jgi:hypothetical protein
MEEKKVKEVNPKKCYFIAKYADGKIVKGNALSDTAWLQIPNGIVSLEYELSTGREIKIHRHNAYSASVEVGDDTFYFIDVRCLTEEDVVIYRINLREVPGSSLKIGDVIIGRVSIPDGLDSSWKMAG